MMHNGETECKKKKDGRRKEQEWGRIKRKRSLVPNGCEENEEEEK